MDLSAFDFGHVHSCKYGYVKHLEWNGLAIDPDETARNEHKHVFGLSG